MIPFADPQIGKTEKYNVNDCLNNGYISSNSPYNLQFELKLSDALGLPTIAVSSGTAALQMALVSAGVSPGDNVIVPDLTFGATAGAVKAIGANPILIDVNEYSWGLDFDLVAKAVCLSKISAVIVVHLFGIPADVYKLRDFLNFHHIPLIEDACEAFGLDKDGKRLGTIGDYGCFSFFANKWITTGEGGAICTNIEGKHGILRLIRDHGMNGRWNYVIPGMNFRMSAMQAAIGCAQMDKFIKLKRRRMENATKYWNNLKGRGLWIFCLECDNPNNVARELYKKEIETRPMFSQLSESNAYFDSKAFVRNKVSKSIANRYLCLPTGPHINDKKIDYIIKSVKEVI